MGTLPLVVTAVMLLLVGFSVLMLYLHGEHGEHGEHAPPTPAQGRPLSAPSAGVTTPSAATHELPQPSTDMLHGQPNVPYPMPSRIPPALITDAAPHATLIVEEVWEGERFECAVYWLDGHVRVYGLDELGAARKTWQAAGIHAGYNPMASGHTYYHEHIVWDFEAYDYTVTQRIPESDTRVTFLLTRT